MTASTTTATQRPAEGRQRRPRWSDSQFRAALEILQRFDAACLAAPDVDALLKAECARLRCRRRDLPVQVEGPIIESRREALLAAAERFEKGCRSVGLDSGDVLAWAEGR